MLLAQLLFLAFVILHLVLPISLLNCVTSFDSSLANDGVGKHAQRRNAHHSNGHVHSGLVVNSSHHDGADSVGYLRFAGELFVANQEPFVECIGHMSL